MEIPTLRRKAESASDVGNVSLSDESPFDGSRLPQEEMATASDLARAISEIAVGERWRIEELHTEEGRLDEVFRNITRPDTKQEEAA